MCVGKNVEIRNNNNNVFACYKSYNFTHCLQIPKKNNNKIKRYK
jgi:hypothetical protein